MLNPPQSYILSTTNGHLRLGLVRLVRRQARAVRAILIMVRVVRVDPRVLLQAVVAMIIQMDGVIFRHGDRGLLHLLHRERVASLAAITERVGSQVAT